MSATKNATEEGVELQSQPKAAAVQAPVANNHDNDLIEVDEPVAAEKTSSASDDVSPSTAPHEPKEALDASPVHRKKNFGLFSGSNREKRDIVVKAVMVVMIAILGAATIGLGVKVGMDRHTIHDLQSSVNHSASASVQHMATAATGIEIRGTYLEGMSGVLDSSSNVKLAKKAIDTSPVASDACDDANETLPVATAMVDLAATMTATLVNSAGSSMASFVTANGSMDTLSTSTIDLTGVSTQPVALMTPLLAPSVLMTQASISASHTCAEWGDGAGPCSRPYGSPNSIPASVLSHKATYGGMKTVTYIPPAAESVASVALGATALAAPMSDPDTCGTTATVTVTLTAAANTMTGASTRATVYGTSTQVSFVTLTIAGLSGSPLTTTETVVWSNYSAASATQVVTSINGSLTTLSRANFTITMPATASSGAMTTTAIVQSPTGSSGALASGGERSVPKPLSASSSAGSGVYCAVMLLALVALLF